MNSLIENVGRIAAGITVAGLLVIFIGDLQGIAANQAETLRLLRRGDKIDCSRTDMRGSYPDELVAPRFGEVRL